MKFDELIGNLKITGCSYRWNYPVIKYDRGQVRTCCQVYNNHEITEAHIQAKGIDVFLNYDHVLERRNEMLKGFKHHECSPCWKLESVNMASMRGRGEPILEYLSEHLINLNPNEELSEQDLHQLTLSKKPRILEIQLDNVCDLACIYCNADYSTTWAKKTGKTFTIPTSDKLSKFQEEFWKWYESIFHELDGICIIGGEPMASPNFFNVLEKLSLISEKSKGKDNKTPYLSITSNFNARPDIFNKFLKTLDVVKGHFKISINASIESIGEKAEFIRDNLVWSRFENNVFTFLNYTKSQNMLSNNKKIDFSLHAAQNIFSLMYLKEFLEWANDLEKQFEVPINLIQNTVYYPTHFSIQSIAPKQFNKYLIEAIDFIHTRTENKKLIYVPDASWKSYKTFLETLLNGMESRSPEENSVIELKKWINELDAIKKEKFLTYFSDLI